MNIVIIEDEAAAIRRLEKMILTLRPETQVLARLDSVEHAVQWFLEHKNEAELAFMDIQLADGASFEIFEHVEVHCPIIFTTAYDEFALQAFKVHAIDYLLKPIKHPELEAALDKFTSKYSTPKVNALIEALKGRQNSTQMQRILVKLGNAIRLVDISEVAYFYTRDKISFLITNEGKRYPVDYPLDRLEQMLDEARFFRINRQTILNIDSIKEMHTHSKSRLKIYCEPSHDNEFIVSTEKTAKFKKWLVAS